MPARIECPYHETPPIDSVHRLSRQLMQAAIRHDAHELYESLELPADVSLPRLATHAISQNFTDTLSARGLPKPDGYDFDRAKGFLVHGIGDSFRFFDTYAGTYADEATFVHSETTASIAHLAKRDGDSLYQLLRNDYAYRSVSGSGIHALNDEPISIYGGCPEVSATGDMRSEATPTRLFGRFVIWTGQLYIAAHSTDNSTAPQLSNQ